MAMISNYINTFFLSFTGLTSISRNPQIFHPSNRINNSKTSISHSHNSLTVQGNPETSKDVNLNHKSLPPLRSVESHHQQQPFSDYPNDSHRSKSLRQSVSDFDSPKDFRVDPYFEHSSSLISSYLGDKNGRVQDESPSSSTSVHVDDYQHSKTADLGRKEVNRFRSDIAPRNTNIDVLTNSADLIASDIYREFFNVQPNVPENDNNHGRQDFFDSKRVSETGRDYSPNSHSAGLVNQGNGGSSKHQKVHRQNHNTEVQKTMVDDRECYLSNDGFIYCKSTAQNGQASEYEKFPSQRLSHSKVRSRKYHKKHHKGNKIHKRKDAGIRSKAFGNDSEDHVAHVKDHGAHGKDHGAHGKDHGAHGKDRGAHGKDRGAHGNDHGAHGNDHGAHGKDHGAHGKNHGADFKDHGAHGKDHGAHGKDHGTHDKDYGAHGKDHGSHHSKSRDRDNQFHHSEAHHKHHSKNTENHFLQTHFVPSHDDAGRSRRYYDDANNYLPVFAKTRYSESVDENVPVGTSVLSVSLV